MVKNKLLELKLQNFYAGWGTKWYPSPGMVDNRLIIFFKLYAFILLTSTLVPGINCSDANVKLVRPDDFSATDDATRMRHLIDIPHFKLS